MYEGEKIKLLERRHQLLVDRVARLESKDMNCRNAENHDGLQVDLSGLRAELNKGFVVLDFDCGPQAVYCDNTNDYNDGVIGDGDSLQAAIDDLVSKLRE